jgi:hypothetical protein
MTRLVKLASLKANLEREKKGDWVPHPDLPGVSFNVSALTLPEYKTARSLLFQRLGKTFGDKPIPDEVLSSEIGALYCDHILHDWKGLDEEYSPEVARSTLTDPAYRVVVSAVEFCAAKLSQVDVEFTKAEEGNS